MTRTEEIKKEIEEGKDDVDYIMEAAGSEITGICSIDCPHCDKRIDVEDIIRKVKLKAELRGRQDVKKEVKEIIEDVDLKLLLTDIKNKEGKKFELSDELMELFRTFWEVYLEKELNSEVDKI